jgi:hypothetical protein
MLTCIDISNRSGYTKFTSLVQDFSTIDGFVKSPHAALCCILRHCSVRQVRFIPQNLHALPANILQSRPEIDFLRGHHDGQLRKKSPEFAVVKTPLAFLFIFLYISDDTESWKHSNDKQKQT